MIYATPAQIGADPRAIVDASILYLVLLAVLGILLIAGLALYGWLLSKSRRLRRFSFHPATIVAAIVLLIGASCWYFLPRPINVDFSRGHHVSVVSWPPNRKENYYYPQGDFLLNLKLPGGKVYKDLTVALYYKREGDLIISAEAAGGPKTLDAAYDRIQELCREWGAGPSEDINEWRARARTGDLNSFGVRLQGSNSNMPEVTAEVLPSFNEQRPWYIMFEVYWPKAVAATEETAMP